jgi:hypothetical protein
VPSPQYLAVAVTMIVHPSTTTRAKTTEEREAPVAALQLLRLTNTLAGPISAKFNVAFAFTHFSSSRHGGRRRADDIVFKKEASPDDMEPLNLDLGQSGSLWLRAEDFWHAVGWAFNCSILHPRRWERWRLWLQFMCEVLEDDWRERQEQFNEATKQSQPGTPSKHREAKLKQSLMFKYLITSNAGFGRNRRILRAVFADGNPTSINEFREVFKHELKELSDDDDNPKKREVDVNIDKDEYGDYMIKDEDSSDEVDASKIRPKRAKRGAKPADESPAALPGDSRSQNAVSGVAALGGFQSLELRQRLLHLLSVVSEQIPRTFIPLFELYHLFVEHIRHLPLPAFQAFVSPTVLPYFSSSARTTLCELLLFSMRESAAPDTDEEYLSQAKLEKCFLPYAANTSTVVDNTKVSILLESLLTLLAETELLRVTPDLKQAVTNGILARNEKAQEETRRNHNSRVVESIEWCWLIESGERLLFLVEDILPRDDP